MYLVSVCKLCAYICTCVYSSTAASPFLFPSLPRSSAHPVDLWFSVCTRRDSDVWHQRHVVQIQTLFQFTYLYGRVSVAFLPPLSFSLSVPTPLAGRRLDRKSACWVARAFDLHTRFTGFLQAEKNKTAQFKIDSQAYDMISALLRKTGARRGDIKTLSLKKRSPLAAFILVSSLSWIVPKFSVPLCAFSLSQSTGRDCIWGLACVRSQFAADETWR